MSKQFLDCPDIVSLLKEMRGKRMAQGATGDMFQKDGNFVFFHVERMAFLMKEDIPSDPVQVGFLRPVALVLQP